MFRRTCIRLLSIVLALCLLLPAVGASAEGGVDDNPYLLKDIRATISEGSNPRWLMPAGEVTFFYVTNADGVSELWKTDGTAVGTQLVKSNLLPASSNDDYGRIPDEGQFIYYDGILYFPAHEPEEGSVLWRTDGTAAGTYPLLDWDGNTIGPPGFMFEYDGTLYMKWTDQLFTSDGTPEGTGLTHYLLRSFGNIVPFLGNLYYVSQNLMAESNDIVSVELSPPAIYPSTNLDPYANFDLSVVNDHLCFSADGYGLGYELWCADGAGNIVNVMDINTNGSSYPNHPYVFDGYLYFAADDGNGNQLWRTDGTSAGATLVQDISNGESEYLAYVFIGEATTQGSGQPKLIYYTSRGSESQLWGTDGTSQGTVLLGAGLRYDHHYYAAYNGWVYYTGYDVDHGVELWRTDGTPENTALFADIFPGNGSSAPWALAPCGDKLCFAADDGQHGVELWATDGTPGGTAMVVDLNPNPPSSEPWGFTQAGNQVFFIAKDNVSQFNLWRTDGTVAGTIALNDDPSITFSSPSYIYEPQMVTVGSKVFMAIGDEVRGYELWVSDGTPAGTKMVKDISSGGYSSLLTAAGSRVFFVNSTPANGRELWVSDGSAAGTHLVKDIIDNDTPEESIRLVTGFGDNVLFTIYKWNTDETELWLSDGSPEGTYFIDSYNLIRSFTQARGKVYFIGSQGSFAPLMIFETDGTSDGTILITKSGGYDDLISIYSDGVNVFFIDEVISFYHDLYVYETDTQKIKFVTELYGPKGSASARPLCFPLDPGLACAVADYGFTPGDGSMYRNIWLTDGSSVGTHILSGDFTDSGDFIPRGSKAVFSAETATEGRQLWESDGTEAGTQQLSHFTQAMCSPGRDYFSFPTMSYLRGQYLLLLDDAGSDPAHGCELWAYNMVVPQAYLPLLRK